MELPKRRAGEVLVVPLEFFTRAETDMDTGGKLLKRLEWFFREYEQGHIVLAHTGRGFEPPTDRLPVSLPDVELMRCPLGDIMRHGPFMTSWDDGGIISRTKATKVAYSNRKSVRESE